MSPVILINFFCIVSALYLTIFLNISQYSSGEYSHWDVFMRKIEPIAARVPYQVSPGNHEIWFNFSAYKKRFVMPDNGTNDALYHNHVVGNRIHFIGMDTEAFWDTACKLI
jgi:hypothetical protein